MEQNTEFGAVVSALRPLVGISKALSERTLTKVAGALDAHTLPLGLHLMGDTRLLHVNPGMAHVLGVTAQGPAQTVDLPPWFITDVHVHAAVHGYLSHFGTQPRTPFAQPVRWPQPIGGHTCLLWLAHEVGTTLKRPVVLNALVPLVQKADNDPMAARMATLLPREREVMRLFCLGRSAAEVATELGITRHTVNTHRYHIRQKLGLGDVFRLLRSDRGEAD